MKKILKNVMYGGHKFPKFEINNFVKQRTYKDHIFYMYVYNIKSDGKKVYYWHILYNNAVLLKTHLPHLENTNCRKDRLAYFYRKDNKTLCASCHKELGYHVTVIMGGDF